MRVGHYNSPAIESSGCKSGSRLWSIKACSPILEKKKQGQEAANALKKNFSRQGGQGAVQRLNGGGGQPVWPGLDLIRSFFLSDHQIKIRSPPTWRWEDNISAFAPLPPEAEP